MSKYSKFFVIIASVLLLIFVFALIQNTLSSEGTGIFEKREYSLPQTGTIIIGEKQSELFDKNNIFINPDYNSLVINNRNEDSSDIVAIVTHHDLKDPIVGYFIQNVSSIGIPLKNGDYDIYLHTGQNWNPKTKKFERYSTYNKWYTSISFPMIFNGSRWMVYEISPEIVKGPYSHIIGTSTISEKDFPYISI